jgi:3-deoxy-D-manno-octulosonic-acid transferase
MIPFGLRLYRFATGLAQFAAPALLRRRAGAGKEDRARMGERLGRTTRARPSGGVVWMHGASVGESLSLLPLIKAVGRHRPDLTVLVTSGTVTAAEMMAKRLPPEAVHQFAPVDAPRAVRRFLDHWRPELAVLVESELWPNLILEARRRDVGLALLSARLSERSAARWLKAPKSARALLSAFDLVMAQDDEAAARLSGLGARDDGRLNLKLAGEPLPVKRALLDAAREAAGSSPVLVAASTHPGEDEIVLDAFAALAKRKDRPLLVIAPRHPVRGLAIATLARSRGFTTGLRSEGDRFGDHEVHVADTLGELGLWLRIAGAALVGGSLLPGPGGHNPVEPAQLGCPILTGPHVDNWASVYALFEDGEAVIEVRDAAGLAQAFADVLGDPKAAAAQVHRAKAIVDAQAGAVNAAADLLLALLPEGAEA